MQNNFDVARALPIVEVAEKLGVVLQPAGHGTYAGACPAGCARHDGFVVFAQDNRYWCRPGGHQGTPIDLVMLVEHTEAHQAVKMLLSMNLSPMAVGTHHAPPAQPTATPEALRALRVRARKRHEGLMVSEYAQPHRDYLVSRGIEPHAWEMFKLGAAQYSISIPWLDHAGNLLGINHRRIAGEGPRYWWENRIYPAGRLFGGVSHTGQPRETLIIVEGELNAISIWQASGGLADVLSTGSETATPPANTAAFSRWREIICWFDGAGRANEWAAAVGGSAFTHPQDANAMLTAGAWKMPAV